MEWRDQSALYELLSSELLHAGIIHYSHTFAYKNKFFLTQKYVVEGLSARQIATQIFSSKSTVTANLARFGIPLRDPHLPHGNPSQPKYGDKIRKGKAVDHVAEKRVVETVRMLNADGISLRKIARMLDQMKIPTKCRGKKWQAEMVRRILNS